MDFRFTEEQEKLRKEIHVFLLGRSLSGNATLFYLLDFTDVGLYQVPPSLTSGICAAHWGQFSGV